MILYNIIYYTFT